MEFSVNRYVRVVLNLKVDYKNSHPLARGERIRHGDGVECPEGAISNTSRTYLFVGKSRISITPCAFVGNSGQQCSTSNFFSVPSRMGVSTESSMN